MDPEQHLAPDTDVYADICTLPSAAKGYLLFKVAFNLLLPSPADLHGTDHHGTLTLFGIKGVEEYGKLFNFEIQGIVGLVTLFFLKAG